MGSLARFEPSWGNSIPPYDAQYDVDHGTRFLLGACAETLIMQYPTDPCGEQPPPNDVQTPVNDFAARSSLRDFVTDLSRNESVRTLQIQAPGMDLRPNDCLLGQ